MTGTDKRHNGWTNYATWRVNLEVFDGYDPDGVAVTGDGLADYVDELVGSLVTVDGAGSLVIGWVGAFLSEVNWQEIADAINEAHELDEDEDAA